MVTARKTYTLILLFISCFLAAQDQSQKPVDLQDYQYKHEASAGARLQSNGFTVYGEYGWIKDLNRTRLLQVEYTYYIDYHQQKRQVDPTLSGPDYIYGLQNHFHTIRINYGIKRTIADKADKNGVRLSLIAFGGVALGLLKPYYLNLTDTLGSSTIKPERYSSANADRFLSPAYIAGSAPLRYGLDQIQPVVGLHGKIGLNFDWGKKDQFVKAIEAGAMLDVYYERLPIMINKSNHFYQLALYVAFHLGKRW